MDDNANCRLAKRAPIARPRVLLVGPYDPNCGEYTFLAPPLGVWRLQGFLSARDVLAQVFDPNLRPECCEEDFRAVLRAGHWDLIGISTTGMTLAYDLKLAYIARAACPGTVLVAGGMEATFNPERMFTAGPFDLVILGEGERTLFALCERLRQGASIDSLAGTVRVDPSGELRRYPARAMTGEELKDAVFHIPYRQMPYESYWRRLEAAYEVGDMPYKAQREAKLAEIRSVRLITLNYCPMGCTFCSSTNFLNQAQGSTAAIARLSAEECLQMIQSIVAAHPGVRTIIFQDDIFVFTSDKRVLPLCDAIVAAKAKGELPRSLSFISTNRIDAMTSQRLRAMRAAGFRVLGFGIENFSRRVLAEFHKGQIHRHIEPVLREALDLGITPFLDLILTSPHSTLEDLTQTVREAHRWIRARCEIGIYPYVIPFSGAALSKDPALKPHTIYEVMRVSGTNVEWSQATKILPLDPRTRAAILEIERNVLDEIQASRRMHLPSRDRSLLWISHAIPVLRSFGQLDSAEEADDRPRERPMETSSCVAS
jgi:anaerobic magnesium-protoporphyrin IX monomethyl ester cyclase